MPVRHLSIDNILERENSDSIFSGCQIRPSFQDDWFDLIIEQNIIQTNTTFDVEQFVFGLTERQSKIVFFLLNGYRKREIKKLLGTTEWTIWKELKKIKEKAKKQIE